MEWLVITNIIIIIAMIGLVFYCAGLRGRVNILENIVGGEVDDEDINPNSISGKISKILGFNNCDLFDDEDDKSNNDIEFINMGKSIGGPAKVQNDTDRDKVIVKKNQDLTVELFKYFYGIGGAKISLYKINSEEELIGYCSQHKLLLYDIKGNKFRIIKYLDNYESDKIMMTFTDDSTAIFDAGIYASTY